MRKSLCYSCLLLLNCRSCPSILLCTTQHKELTAWQLLLGGPSEGVWLRRHTHSAPFLMEGLIAPPSARTTTDILRAWAPALAAAVAWAKREETERAIFRQIAAAAD